MTDKITREEAERALEKATEMCDMLVASNTPGMTSISAAILRQCRIIEPGGLDAETLRWVGANLESNGFELIGKRLQDQADEIEKGE